MIESFGAYVDVASNGLEVLDRVKSADYDIIFMDCQMPLMDGFEATRSVRERENRLEAPKAVIVALTANAADEDRHRCLAAGMDDYLGKPFRMQDLFNMIEKWRPGTSAFGSAGKPEEVQLNSAPSKSETANYLDRSPLESIRSLGPQGPVMLAAIIEIYLNDSPILLDRLIAAFDAGDAEGMALAAHSLKSTSAGVGACAFGALCRQVESVARGNSIEGLDALILRIRSEYGRVKEALEREAREVP